MGNRKPMFRLLILTVAAVLTVSGFAGCGEQTEETKPVQEPSGTVSEVPTEEAAGVALPTRYIVLSYPAEIQEDVTVTYEDLKDGQKVIFTTGFTGEELELFQFVISKSDSEGYLLGTLNHEQEGQLFVCVNVHEYSEGNMEVGDYTKLNALQERVNDIIVQFHSDSRFTPVTQP